MKIKNIFLSLGIILVILGISMSILSSYNFSYSEIKNEAFTYTYYYANKSFRTGQLLDPSTSIPWVQDIELNANDNVTIDIRVTASTGRDDGNRIGLFILEYDKKLGQYEWLPLRGNASPYTNAEPHSISILIWDGSKSQLTGTLTCNFSAPSSTKYSFRVWVINSNLGWQDDCTIKFLIFQPRIGFRPVTYTHYYTVLSNNFFIPSVLLLFLGFLILLCYAFLKRSNLTSLDGH